MLNVLRPKIANRLKQSSGAGIVALALVAVVLGLSAPPAKAQSQAGGADPAASGAGRPSSGPSRTSEARFAGESASTDARAIADWVARVKDNQGMPFIIVDKKNTKVFVFDGEANLLGATSALIGLARGDESAPGVGDKKLSSIRPNERTTAAGRFVASLGQDLSDQDVLWVDYKAALALHRVLSRNSKEARLQRMASGIANDHRITFGCIDVPVIFYDRIVHPSFAESNGVVYILPEEKSLSAVFPMASVWSKATT